MRKISHHNKGQVSETIHWVLATIAIAIIVFASISVASIIGNKRSLFGQNSIKTFTQTNAIDLFAKESLISYLLTENPSGVPVYQQIEQDSQAAGSGGFNDFDGNLAVNIFGNLYASYYTNYVFLGVIDTTKGSCALFNTYFKSPAVAMCYSGVPSEVPIVTDLVSISNNIKLKLLLWKST